MYVNVILTPSEIETLLRSSQKPGEDESTVSVVFDALRATSSIIVALNNGAKMVIPAESIEEALELKKNYKNALLAGERNGLKIPPSMTGGIEFDLGNSPREFTREKVAEKIIITTTTNGTRAIKSAMQKSAKVLICSFLNISATAQYIKKLNPLKLVIFCSGTRDEPALEDIMAAGCLIEKINAGDISLSDSAIVAKECYYYHQNDLSSVMKRSANARRLLNIPELSADVDFCFQTDLCDIVAVAKNGKIVIEN